MIDTSNPNKLLHTPVYGFETKHLYYHSDRKAAWVFNALRITSYIPFIGALPAYIAFSNVNSAHLPRLNQLKNEVVTLQQTTKKINHDKEVLETAVSKYEELHQTSLNTIDSMKTSIAEGDEQLQLHQQKKILNIAGELTEMTPEIQIATEELQDAAEKSNARFEELSIETKWAEKILEVVTNLFFRFIVSGIGLGVLFLPFDLYHTRWLACTVTPLRNNNLLE